MQDEELVSGGLATLIKLSKPLPKLPNCAKLRVNRKMLVLHI